ncbi:MAG: hypothetical protein IT378_27765 [Sandaracinaceae bacterium]|nr:hypothetical protein [Sandaracinaceae bacterium]
MRTQYFLASCVFAVGCSALVTPDPGRLGDEDGGGIVIRIDSGTADAGMVPQPDSGPPPVDGGPADAFVPSCTNGTARCEGEVLVRCDGGREVRTDCAADASYCDGTECRAQVCDPGSITCSGSGLSSIVCNDRGSAATTTPCANGCDPASGMCRDRPPACAGLPAVELNAPLTFNLCTETDGDTYVVSTGCPANTRADSGDRTFVLTIARAGTYMIDLRDADTSRGIDTAVYLRRSCDDATSQIACDDDVPCNMSDIMTGCSSSGVQVRQSRIVTALEPGTYYVVADAFVYDSFQCGQVLLRVSAALTSTP